MPSESWGTKFRSKSQNQNREQNKFAKNTLQPQPDAQARDVNYCRRVPGPHRVSHKNK